MSAIRQPGHEPDANLTAMKDWTPALRKHRQARARTVQRVRELTEACKTAHEKRHVVECRECYGKVVDEVRSRYLGPGEDAPPEWCRGRNKFLADLDRMFADAREFRVQLGDIDKRIRREERAWYREGLRRYSYFLEVAVNPSTGERFQQLLDNEDSSLDELERIVSAGTQRFKGQPINLEEFMKVHGETHPDKARDDLIRLLFEGTTYPTDWIKSKDPPPNLDLGDLESVVSAVEEHAGHQPRTTTTTTPTTPAAAADAKAVRDRLQKQAYRKEEMDRVRSRIYELHRAKAAHERQQVAKSEKKRKQSARAFYEVTCATCGMVPDPKEGRDVLACAMCQMLVEFGALEKQTAYCSEECMEQGFGNHIRERHTCEAGANCTSHSSREFAPESISHGCKVCASDLGRLTLFCSDICASINLGDHLKKMHPELWERTGAAERKSKSPRLANGKELVVDVEKLYVATVAPKIEDKDLAFEWRWNQSSKR